MNAQFPIYRLKEFRFPNAIASYVIWNCHRFAMSLRDVEGLLASQGIEVSFPPKLVPRVLLKLS